MTAIFCLARTTGPNAAATVVLVVALLLGECSNVDGLIAESTAPVLVTTDTKFLDTLEFTAADAANNDVVRSNSSPEFDPDVNPDLFIESYQVNDVSTWTAEVVDDRQVTRDVYVAVIADVEGSSADGPCTLVLEDPVVVRCVYDVGQVEPATKLVRRFDKSSPMAMSAVGNQPQTLDYISGEFTTMSPSTAGETFPRD